MTSSDNSQSNEIFRHLSRLFKPDELVEYRAITWNMGGRGLYFTDLQRLAEVVAKLDADPRVQSSYVVINPLKGRLIRERGLLVNPTDEQVEQIIAAPGGKTATNDDVEMLRWMFIDIDTGRAPGFEKEPSTDEEKARSRAVAVRVLSFLKEEKGWPHPIVCDSGNGWHLLFRVNLQNTTANFHLIADCLKALKAKFDCADADIDASVFNPARLTRAYGSTTRKGTDTTERPYRRNGMFPSNHPVGDVTLDMLLSLSVESPSYSKHSDSEMPELDPDFDPHDWIAWYADQGAFEIKGEKEWQGFPIIATEECLYAHRVHSGYEYKSGFIVGDNFGYKCFSSDCDGLTIKEVYKWLREAKNDDGTPKFKPYPKPIYKTETIDELLDGFADKANEAEGIEQQAKQIEIEDDEPDAAKAPESVPSAATNAQSEQPKQAQARTEDEIDKLCDKLTSNLVRAMLWHPEELWLDGFQHYVRRLKSKLGMNTAKQRGKKGRGEVDEITISMPYGETLITIIKYCDAHKRLPDKDALKNFIEVNEKMKDNLFKAEMVAYIDRAKDMPASTFDETANRLIKIMDVRFEIASLRAAIPILKQEEDIQEFRSVLRRNQNKSTVQDSGFSTGAWQETTDEIEARFERKLRGVDNARKFKTNFWTIDHSDMALGLDGTKSICIAGPSNNRKTTFMMALAMNFAIQGKNILFLAGEHHRNRVLDKFTLQLSHFYRNDPEIGPIPGLGKWESINPSVTEADFENLKKVLLKLKSEKVVPGYVEAQTVDAVAQGQESKVDALLEYAEATFSKYQWDAIFIDPIDACMPADSAGGKGNTFQLRADAILKLFNFSTNAFNGRGCMVIITAQFRTEAVRDIQRIQEKNTGAERFDDEIESILRRDGNIHSLTTIIEKFELVLSIATLQKNGDEGLIVKGRDRNGGREWTMYFHVDPDSNYMTENRKPYQKVSEEEAKAAAASSQTMESVDEL